MKLGISQHTPLQRPQTNQAACKSLQAALADNGLNTPWQEDQNLRYWFAAEKQPFIADFYQLRRSLQNLGKLLCVKKKLTQSNE